MKILNKLAVLVVAATGFVATGTVGAQQQDPQELVKRISEEVLETAKQDKGIQGGNQRRVLEVVEEKILPHVDFERMTQLAAARYWNQASPEQKKQLVTEFRSLLVYTYSGAISQIRDQRLQFRPMLGNPAEGEVEVRSQVLQARGEPIQLNYRLEKSGDSWKIYDMNVLGAWLVETYKGNFASEISKGGVDGLIKTLTERNQKLAENAQRGKGS